MRLSPEVEIALSLATNEAWTDKDGKNYCFATEAAKKTFLENPTANLQKARDFIAAGSTESAYGFGTACGNDGWQISGVRWNCETAASATTPDDDDR